MVDVALGGLFNVGVTPDIDLGKLSHAEKDALIRSLLPLVGQLQAALARIAELEKRLAAAERPAKTPDNGAVSVVAWTRPVARQAGPT